MRYGAIFERNPVILEFTSFHNFFTFIPKERYGTKKVEINKILVKFEFNLECGNIRNKRGDE